MNFPLNLPHHLTPLLEALETQFPQEDAQEIDEEGWTMKKQ